MPPYAPKPWLGVGRRDYNSRAPWARNSAGSFKISETVLSGLLRGGAMAIRRRDCLRCLGLCAGEPANIGSWTGDTYLSATFLGMLVDRQLQHFAKGLQASPPAPQAVEGRKGSSGGMGLPAFRPP